MLIKNTKVKYVSAGAGAGKTTRAIANIKNHLKDESKTGQVIIVTKTIELCDQWANELTGFAEIKCIHSNNNNQPSIALRGELSKEPVKNHIIIMTENSWLLVNQANEITKKEERIVYYDEFPYVVSNSKFNFSATKNILTDRICVEEEGDTYLLSPKNKQELKEDAYSGDTLINSSELRKIFNMILAKDVYSVKVSKTHYDDLIDDNNKRSDITFYVGIKEEIYHGYQDFYMLGALFENTLLEKSYKNTKFVNVTFSEFGLNQKQKHFNYNKRLTIKYLTKGNWSKTLMNKISNENNETYWDETVNFLKNNFYSTDALLFLNKDRDKTVLEKIEKFKLLSPVQIGVNAYREYTTSIYLAAINPSNEEVSFFNKNKDISRDEIVRSRTRYNMYQALFRDNMRMTDSEKKCLWVVPTEEDARWLSKLFDDEPEIEKLETEINYSLRTNQYDPEMAKKIDNYIQNTKKQMKSFEKYDDTFCLVSDTFNKATLQTKMTQSEFFDLLEESKEKGTTHVINCAFNNNMLKKSSKILEEAFELYKDSLCYANHKYSNGLVFDFDLDEIEDENKAQIKDVVIKFLEEEKVNFLIRDSSTPGNFHLWVETKQKMSQSLYKNIQTYYLKNIFAGINDNATRSAVQKIHIDKGDVDCYRYSGGSPLDIESLLLRKEFKDIICEHFLEKENEETCTNENNIKLNKQNYERAKIIMKKFNEEPNHNNVYGLVKALRHQALFSDDEIFETCTQNIAYFLRKNRAEKMKKLKDTIKGI